MPDSTRRLPIAVLAVTAVGFGAIGLLALVTPRELAGLAGIALTTDSARADFSAVYSGLHLAFAAVMVAALLLGQVKDGLFAALCAFSGLLLARTWSMLVVGRADTLSLWLVAVEVFGVAATAWATMRAHGCSGRISRPSSRSCTER
jgi:hypothetical protein